MCGFTGFVDFNGNSTTKFLEDMTECLSHRGPDDAGVEILDWSRVQIGLGHRRLSIIDLSREGHQPMHFKNWSIVFNGEIYNYKEIRKSLEKEGYSTDLNSDTAVILMSFDRWGVKAVERFIGMFAFTIVDRETNKVFIFRDRAGVKPVFYYWKNELLLFSSELKSFHKHPAFERKINNDALALYFGYGYIPAPYSIFDNTHKVNSGCFLEVDLSTKQIIEHSYWNVFDYYNKPKINISMQEALEETESILSSAFDYRIVSDVPVGVFLSGGYDSVCVTALLQKVRTEKIKTFTIGFENQKYNEAPYSREVARFLGTDHNEYYCTIKESKDIIPKLSYYYDEPFSDSSAIPTILVSKMARQQVTVALSADGGDETFGGYEKYQSTLRNIGNLKKIPQWVRPSMGALMGVINPSTVPFLNNKFRHDYIYEGFVALLKKEEITAPQIMKLSSQKILNRGISKLFRKNPGELLTPFDSENELNDWNDSLDKIMAIDYKTYLPGDILTKVDRATMSVSLEGREPLLDHRIIEFVATLPSFYKINGNTKKFLLKEIVHKYVPQSMMDRPKMGFAVPVIDWLRSDMKYLISEFLSSEKLSLHDLFDEDYIDEILKKYFEGNNDDFELIWCLLQFQMWFCRWCV